MRVMFWTFVVYVWCGSTLLAGVTRFEITDRTVVAEGQSFGDVGPYERIRGRVHFALDPTHAANRFVVDLVRAPRNAEGRVEFWADLDILSPQDASKGNGIALYDVNNRGNKLALGMFHVGGGGNDPKTESDFGDGFLLKHGFTIVWSGWTGELLPGGDRLQLFAPVARGGDGPLTGLVRCELMVNEPTKRTTITSWANHGTYRPTPRGFDNATLTVREKPGDTRVTVPRSEWLLTLAEVPGDVPTQLPRVDMELPAGFQPGWLYEIIYEAQDPLVMGCGLTGVRDLMAALKAGEGTNNPLVRDGRSSIRRTIGFGVSQSGRFLREYLYWGCNEDESNRQVFDVVWPHVAGGGLGSFNHRFAQPTRHGGQHDHADYPVDRFPFAYEVQTDPLTGQSDGILQRALATKTVPWVLHTQSAAEYWTRAGSLPHTDPLGTRDAEPPNQVRFYAFGGTQHGPAGYPPSRGIGDNLANPADYKPFLRALLLTVARGEEPPDSIMPHIADGTLVPFDHAAQQFPQLRDVRFPDRIRTPLALDYGSRWKSEQIIDRQPPQTIGPYRTLVPAVDHDGNDRGCLLPLEVESPLATYTGWNLRSATAGVPGELVSLLGSSIPFPLTEDDRQLTGDPRQSLAARYRSLEGYRTSLRLAIKPLVADGWLIPEDAERLMMLHTERARPLFAVFADK